MAMATTTTPSNANTSRHRPRPSIAGTLVSEGDDDNSIASSNSNATSDDEDETSAPEGAPASGRERPISHPPEGDRPSNPTYQTQRGRQTTAPERYAATFLKPSVFHLSKSKEHTKLAHVQNCYLAGGNPNRKVKCSTLEDEHLHQINWDPATFLCSRSHHTRAILRALLANRDEGEVWNPHVLAAKGQDPDLNPTWEQAMNGPLKQGYESAARKEYETLAQMNVWDVVDQKPWMNVLP